MFPFFAQANLRMLRQDWIYSRLGLKLVQDERGHFFTPSGKKQGTVGPILFVNLNFGPYVTTKMGSTDID